LPERSFFLRVGDHVRRLEPGELVVGRSSKADVRLDDDMVSRRHCIIRVSESVMLDDLSSRNGVLVNGARVAKRSELRHGDEITIGRHRLVLTEGRATLPMNTPDPSALRETIPHDTQETKTGSIYEMFTATSQTALESGDLESAQNLASNLFVSLRAAFARGQDPGEAFGEGVALGLRLAREARDRRWIDRICVLHSAAGRVMAPAVVAELEALDRSGIQAPSAIARYAAELKKRFGDEQAVALDRIAALAARPAEPRG
jgi:pSer/pThr/pTyr-binding forkhead associated (FHA) protein